MRLVGYNGQGSELIISSLYRLTIGSRQFENAVVTAILKKRLTDGLTTESGIKGIIYFRRCAKTAKVPSLPGQKKGTFEGG